MLVCIALAEGYAVASVSAAPLPKDGIVFMVTNVLLISKEINQLTFCVNIVA